MMNLGADGCAMSVRKSRVFVGVRIRIPLLIVMCPNVNSIAYVCLCFLNAESPCFHLFDGANLAVYL